MNNRDILLRHEEVTATSKLFLDDLTSLAAHTCRAPLAMLLLGRGSLLRAASWCGLNEIEAIELSSLSVHQNLPTKGLILPDVLDSQHFANEAAADKGAGIRFYSGVPLLDRNGEIMGVLCVMDREPREPHPRDLEALEKLSRLAVAEMQADPALARRPAISKPPVQPEENDLVKTLTLARNGAEESLSRERNLSDSIINSLPGIFYLFNKEGKFLRWNKNLEKATGYSTDDILRMGPQDFFAPEDRELIAQRIESAFENGQAAIETTAVLKNGKRTPYFFTGTLMLYHGQACVLGMGMDITERRRVEKRQEALSKLGQNLSSATTAEEAARIIGDVADELFGWHSCAANLYPGGRVYPILNMDIIDGKRRNIPMGHIGTEPSERAKKIMQDGPQLFLLDEPRATAPGANAFGDKSRPSASLMMAPIRNRTSAIGILCFASYTRRAYDHQDLQTLKTLADHCGGALERIRVEQELKTSEKLFHSSWAHSVDGMRLTDEAGTIVAVNAAFCTLMGIEEKELVGKPFTVIYSLAENQEQILARYRQRFKTKKVEKIIERKLTIWSGKTLDLEVTNSVIELSDNKRMVLGLFRDITEHKRAEEELRKSEAQLRLVWENSLDGMRLLDGRGIFMMVNEAFCRMVDKPREKLLGQPLAIIYEPAHEEKIMRLYCERFREKLIPPHREKEVTLWNGKKLFWELSNSLLEVEEQPTLCLSLVRDITISKRVQRKIQLLEQQRALEKERDRIARDMHDDVGGSLTRITLLTEIAEAEIAAGKIIASDDAKGRIQKISTMSRELVRNIDEIVWAVNPGNDSLEKFASYICHLTEELLKVTTINCRLDVPTILPNYFLGSDIRHNLFLVVKESLTNVIKHSEATEVSLQMGIAGAEFTITIADNGKGFDAANLRPFSNGLTNMRKRMEKIGGTLKLKSVPENGTTVALGINLEK